MLDWFSKAVKTVQDASDQQNASIQGSYTDHQMSPYQKRMSLEPMHGDELEAFEWVIAKMSKESDPDAPYRDLIDMAIDAGWFFIDKDGMLRVSQEMP